MSKKEKAKAKKHQAKKNKKVKAAPLTNFMDNLGATAAGATTTGPRGNAGPTGIQGPPGPQGTTGVKGPTGPAGNKWSYLVVNGFTGPSGKKGKPGTDGTNGTDGINGKNGKNGLNGLPGGATVYTPHESLIVAQGNMLTDIWVNGLAHYGNDAAIYKDLVGHGISQVQIKGGNATTIKFIDELSEISTEANPVLTTSYSSGGNNLPLNAGLGGYFNKGGNWTVNGNDVGTFAPWTSGLSRDVETNDTLGCLAFELSRFFGMKDEQGVDNPVINVTEPDWYTEYLEAESPVGSFKSIFMPGETFNSSRWQEIALLGVAKGISHEGIQHKLITALATFLAPAPN